MKKLYNYMLLLKSKIIGANHGEGNHNAKTQNNAFALPLLWLRGIESVRVGCLLSTGSETQRGNGENA
jgi:hypothetical protein